MRRKGHGNLQREREPYARTEKITVKRMSQAFLGLTHGILVTQTRRIMRRYASISFYIIKLGPPPPTTSNQSPLCAN